MPNLLRYQLSIGITENLASNEQKITPTPRPKEY